MANHQFIQQLNLLKYKTRKQEKYDEGHGQVGNGRVGNGKLGKRPREKWRTENTAKWKPATWNGTLTLDRSRCDLIETWWLWLTLPELLKRARWPRPRRLAARPRHWVPRPRPRCWPVVPRRDLWTSRDVSRPRRPRPRVHPWIPHVHLNAVSVEIKCTVLSAISVPI